MSLYCVSAGKNNSLWTFWTVQDFGPTFVGEKPQDISNETSKCVPAIFVAVKQVF